MIDSSNLNSLLKKDAYSHKISKISRIDTHISWIFLTGKFVYKIKRPVKFTFLDFSSLENRKFFCQEEIRLNSRLSPEIYLEVVPVYEQNNSLNFRNQGKIVDYAVKLKQLPSEKKMDLLLRKKKVTKKHIETLAEIISKFHSKVDVIKDTKYGNPEIVKAQINDLNTVKETIDKELSLGHKVDNILQKCDAFIDKNSDLFRQRQLAGRIKDCHGDLHSANIFLADKIYVFDCIEFNNGVRFIDTASEIAFMAMDLDYFKQKKLSKAFVESYVSKTGDSDLLKLLDLYKSYRANVRAKVASLELLHPVSEAQRKSALKRIANYLELAESYAQSLY